MDRDKSDTPAAADVVDSGYEGDIEMESEGHSSTASSQLLDAQMAPASNHRTGSATVPGNYNKDTVRGKSFIKMYENHAFFEGMVRLVHWSNYIESAGFYREGLDMTRQAIIGAGSFSKPDLVISADHDTAQRKTLEVLHHAAALRFAIESAVVGDATTGEFEWTEDFVKRIHVILCTGLGSEDVIPGECRDHEVAVFYRDVDDEGKAEAAKSGTGGGNAVDKKQRHLNEGKKKPKKTECIRARAVKPYMADMVEELNKDLRRIRRADIGSSPDASRSSNHTHTDDDNSSTDECPPLEPHTLAAKYAHQFVMIHPFGDGNGRVKRIILNVLLLKLAGEIAPFGTGLEEKKVYMNIVTRGHKVWHKEDKEVDFSEQTSHLEMAEWLKTVSEGFE